jgi:hypothetical protein
MNERKKKRKSLVVKFGPSICSLIRGVNFFFSGGLLPSFDPGCTYVEFNSWMIRTIWRTDDVSCGS